LIVNLVYADNSVKKALEKLEKKDKELFRHVKNAFENIKEDPVCGIKFN